MIRVLFVGQIPPPHGGQAIIQQVMLEGHYRRIQFFHVCMAFSREMDEVGRFHIKKLFHLISVIFRIIYMRLRYRIPIIYYPPAGPNRIPMYRDIAILLCTRWLFKKTVFHFHAGGISELYRKLSHIEQLLFRLAYFEPALSIRLSELNPPDGAFLNSQKDIIVPNGIADRYIDFIQKKENEQIPTILFVGIVRESKGVLVLLDACRLMKESGGLFQLKIMGKFDCKVFKQKVYRFVENNGLKDNVDFLGVCICRKKWRVYNAANIFCFPTFFESEALPLVVLEAMQFKLPVVATRWRGIPSLVEDGKSGFLVSIRDSRAVAEKLSLLLNSPDLRKKMGERGRQIYLKRFTLDKFLHNIEKAVLTIV
jgi:glycosyltransferase involved in cell wall biosynthesis